MLALLSFYDLINGTIWEYEHTSSLLRPYLAMDAMLLNWSVSDVNVAFRFVVIAVNLKGLLRQQMDGHRSAGERIQNNDVVQLVFGQLLHAQPCITQQNILLTALQDAICAALSFTDNEKAMCTNFEVSEFF